MSVGERVAVQDLFYGFGKANFTPNSKKSLEFIVGILKEGTSMAPDTLLTLQLKKLNQLLMQNMSY